MQELSQEKWYKNGNIKSRAKEGGRKKKGVGERRWQGGQWEGREEGSQDNGDHLAEAYVVCHTCLCSPKR